MNDTFLSFKKSSSLTCSFSSFILSSSSCWFLGFRNINTKKTPNRTTLIGWAKKIDAKIDIINENSHLRNFSLPNSIPFTIMKKIETPIRMYDATNPIILNHHGSLKENFDLDFLLSFSIDNFSILSLQKKIY